MNPEILVTLVAIIGGIAAYFVSARVLNRDAGNPYDPAEGNDAVPSKATGIKLIGRTCMSAYPTGEALENAVLDVCKAAGYTVGATTPRTVTAAQPTDRPRAKLTAVAQVPSQAAAALRGITPIPGQSNAFIVNTSRALVEVVRTEDRIVRIYVRPKGRQYGLDSRELFAAAIGILQAHTTETLDVRAA